METSWETKIFCLSRLTDKVNLFFERFLDFLQETSGRHNLSSEAPWESRDRVSSKCDSSSIPSQTDFSRHPDHKSITSLGVILSIFWYLVSVVLYFYPDTKGLEDSRPSFDSLDKSTCISFKEWVFPPTESVILILTPTISVLGVS